MYTKHVALDFIADSEFIRERARIEAREILDDFDASEVLENPEQAASDIVDELVALLLLSLIGTAVRETVQHAMDLGLAEVPLSDTADVVDEAIEDVHGVAEAEIAARLSETDRRLRADGTSEETLLETVESPQDAQRSSLESPGSLLAPQQD